MSSRGKDVWGYLYAYDRDFPSAARSPVHATEYPVLKTGYFVQELRTDEVSVGREGCDILLPEKTANISRKHFTVGLQSDGRTTLVDCSMNGTFVNGKLVGRGNSVPLRHNDVVSLVQADTKSFVFMKTEEEEKYASFNPHPREVRAKYSVSYVIGEGGYGQVSLVFDKRTYKKYALKYIEKDPEADDSLLMNEVKILQGLDHPFVIHFKELISTPTSLCILLELMEGEDLYTRIYPENKLTEATTKLVFFQTVSAVSYLHSQDITHRDLKPQNILLSSHHPETLVKVTDFGVSKKDSDMQTVIGTLFFIAPEILRQHFQQRTYTNQVDVWSLGVILFNWNPAATLLGQYSFDESLAWDLVSEDVKDLISQMLRLDPEERITVQKALSHPWFQDEDMKKTLYGLLWERELVAFNEMIQDVMKPLMPKE